MSDTRTRLESLLQDRIAILDGSWGVLIQRDVRGEEAYRGERFRDHPRDVAGDPDLLNLTRPEVVLDIHRAYFAAGADITTTNTFTATRIGQADYGLEAAVYEMNVEGARLARQAADEAGGRFVAGSVGPLNVTLSLSPRVEDPGFRAVTFDEVCEAYAEQMRGLVEGGVDVLLIETVFDTLNAKAALVAAREAAPDTPLWVSFTAIDQSGRNLSGQTAEAFLIAVEHADPLVVGINCSLGAGQMRPFLEDLARSAIDLRRLPSERRPPEPARRVRRAAARHEPHAGRVRARRPREPGRRLLRDDARAHGRDRRGRPGRAAADDPRAERAAALQRPRAVRDRAGHGLRDDRRADQRDRLGTLPPARRGGRLRRCDRGRARPGARRCEPPGRQHGRRPARRRRGDDDLPQPRRRRAGDRAAADRGRQLPAGGARGRPEVPRRQGRRQLDQPQGGRGGVPRARPHDPPLRRGPSS